VGVTPCGLISNPPPSIPPHFFTPDAFLSATLPIYPGLGQAEEYAGLHTPVAWLKTVLSPTSYVLSICSINWRAVNACVCVCVCVCVQWELSDGLAPADSGDVIQPVLRCSRSISYHVPSTNVERRTTSQLQSVTPLTPTSRSVINVITCRAEAKCTVYWPRPWACLCVCLSVPRLFPTLLHGPGCNLGMVGGAL